MSARARTEAWQALTHDLFTRLIAEVYEAELLRVQLHREPRISGDEAGTRDTLIAALPKAVAVEPFTDAAALVRLGPAGPSIAIRAEMDALPMIERTGAAFASTNGAAHACGHDVHMAAFVAVMRSLAASPELPVPVVGLLQPREETFPSGALDFLTSGVLARHRVAAVIGAHVQPAIDGLAIASNAGTVNAASDEFEIAFHGRAAHGAYPHFSRDPVLAASSFVTSVQQVVSRAVDPMSSAVVTVGSIHGGQAPNAIPTTVVIAGTLRTTSLAQQRLVHDRLRQIADGIATVHGCEAITTITFGDPPLINDPVLAHFARQIMEAEGEDASGDFRSFGADDFAFYGRIAPTLMMFVGTAATTGGLHSPSYLPDRDAVRRVAVAMLAGYLAACQALLDGADIRPPVTADVGFAIDSVLDDTALGDAGILDHPALGDVGILDHPALVSDSVLPPGPLVAGRPNRRKIPDNLRTRLLIDDPSEGENQTSQ